LPGVDTGQAWTVIDKIIKPKCVFHDKFELCLLKCELFDSIQNGCRYLEQVIYTRGAQDNSAFRPCGVGKWVEISIISIW